MENDYRDHSILVFQLTVIIILLFWPTHSVDAEIQNSHPVKSTALCPVGKFHFRYFMPVSISSRIATKPLPIQKTSK